MVHFFNFELKLEVHLYLVPDSYSRPQTRESVESAKKGLEYESRLDTPLETTVVDSPSDAASNCYGTMFG